MDKFASAETAEALVGLFEAEPDGVDVGALKEAAVAKRGADLHIWTPEVARAYGALLRKLYYKE